MNWLSWALLSAATFALGDFVMVNSKESSQLVFVLYTIIMGAMSLAILPLMYPKDLELRPKLPKIFGIAILFMAAYYTHYMALITATNPGYANSIIMLHVVFLTALSYWFLDRSLSKMAVLGIMMMLVGAWIISVNSD